MKLEIEIQEPLYKIGDVLEVMCGAEKNIPIVFAITNYVEDGEYTIQNNKIHYQPNRSTYYLSCQINYQDNPLTKWMHKRQFFTWDKEYLENKNARKIKWGKKILPAQTVEYLTAKDEMTEKIKRGDATIQDLDNFAENFL
jgi:formyltetrahydrofolate hydrolase